MAAARPVTSPTTTIGDLLSGDHLHHGLLESFQRLLLRFEGLVPPLT